MKRICAYCGKYMGTKPPFGGLNHEWDKAVTHGICESCKEKEIGELNANNIQKQNR